MITLIAAAASFLLLHLVISGTRMRDALVGGVGRGPIWGCSPSPRWRS